MRANLPPGWPTGVQPPGSDGFERTAVAWLLDVVPADYRLYGVLRRHPVALAAMARHHLTAAVQGARQGYRTVRTELAEALPPHAVDAVLAAYRREGRRLVAAARGVEAVERALREETLTLPAACRPVTGLMLRQVPFARFASQQDQHGCEERSLPRAQPETYSKRPRSHLW